MEKRQYLMIDAAALPEVFSRVVCAKELLAAGEAKNVSEATRKVGLSRSAFYKYRDSVFRAANAQRVATIKATLLDETGALQSLLAAISMAGAGVVTINQSAPENGAAAVAVSVRTEGMQIEMEALCAKLKKQRTVVEVRLKTEDAG